MGRATGRFFVPDNTLIYSYTDEKSASRTVGYDELLSLMNVRDVNGIAWRQVYVKPARLFGQDTEYIMASVPMLSAKYRIRFERIAMYIVFSLVAAVISLDMRVVFPDFLIVAVTIFVVLYFISRQVSQYSNMFGFIEWTRLHETRPSFDLRRFLRSEGPSLVVLLTLIGAIVLLSQGGLL